jgi:D-amino-acid dehydrogenase
MNLALELQTRGHDVTVVEAAPDSMTASLGNAGHIAVEQVDPIASWKTIFSTPTRLFPRGPVSLPSHSLRNWLPFALRLVRASRADQFARGRDALSTLMQDAIPAWRRRLMDLGTPDLMREDGHYVVWETAQSAAKGRLAWSAVNSSTAEFRNVTNDETRTLLELSQDRIQDAIRFKATGQIADLPRLLFRLRQIFVERSGHFKPSKIAALRRNSRNALCQTENGDELTADAIVVCAGVRSRPLLADLGLKIPMIAERGYHIQSQIHTWPDTCPPVVFEDRSIIVTRFESGLRVAGFVEFSDLDAPPDAAKWRRLEQHVMELGLPFGELANATRWMGSRPTLPDYLPALGHVRQTDNLFYAFGHNHLGLTLAAITSELMADVIGGKDAPKTFSLQRFQ